MKTITEMHIRANRWFQKTYGNTYHRVRMSIIYNDGSSDSLDSDRTYGYGETWNQTALSMLIEAGHTTKNNFHVYATQYAKTHGIITHTSVNDVLRQRDL